MLFPASKGRLLSLTGGPSIQPAVCPSPSRAAVSLIPFLTPSSTFKDPCDYTGLKEISQDLLPVLR